jgi:hypothetical protein
MAEGAMGQIIEGLWRFDALLPDWTEQEGSEEAGNKTWRGGLSRRRALFLWTMSRASGRACFGV